MTLPGSAVRGAPTRQRTMRDAIAWSHDLLDAPSRDLFRRFAVFAGGARLPEIERVCGPSTAAGSDVVDALAGLVDQSLVRVAQSPDGVRYEMLRTIRDLALDLLRDDPDRDLIERLHAETYRAFADSHGGDRLDSAEMGRAFEILRGERENLRAAIRWALERAVPEIALGLVAALARFWWLAGEMAEGLSTVEAAFALPGADAATTDRMRALEGAGLLRYYAGDNAGAAADYAAQLELARRLDDAQGQADARFNLLFTQDHRAHPADGITELDAIAHAFQAIGDERSLARTTWVRATLLIADGRLPEATQLMVEAVERLHSLDDVPYEMLVANTLAIGGLMARDRGAAAYWFPRSLALARQLGDMTAIAIALPTYAVAALEFVDAGTAATLLGAYEAMGRRYGVRMPIALEQVMAMLQPDERTRASLDAATYETALAAGRAMDVEQVYTYLDETVGRIRMPAAPGSA